MTQTNNEREKLDVRYFNEKLRLVLEGLQNYTRSELARELQRLSNTASPISQNEQQAIPEDVIKDAKRYNWLKQNYHGFEMFRHSTIPYVTLDREVDKAMLNAAPTNTEVGE